MDFRASIDVGVLITVLGILYKGAKVADQVDMMWTVFAEEHGLSPGGAKRKRN